MNSLNRMYSLYRFTDALIDISLYFKSSLKEFCPSAVRKPVRRVEAEKETPPDNDESQYRNDPIGLF